MARYDGMPSVYAVLVDGVQLGAFHSRVMCMAFAARCVSDRVAGELMQVVKDYPKDKSRNTVVFAWRNTRAGWRVQTTSEAV